MLCRIIRNHAKFDDDSSDSPMKTPAVVWDESKPHDRVWLTLSGYDGKRIRQADIADVAMGVREYMVGYGEFHASDTEGDFRSMVIETRPENVRGYDGRPLTSPQLDGAIADLQRYEDALFNGRFGA
jgi:hypothetical protein